MKSYNAHPVDLFGVVGRVVGRLNEGLPSAVDAADQQTKGEDVAGWAALPRRFQQKLWRYIIQVGLSHLGVLRHPRLRIKSVSECHFKHERVISE